MVQPHENFQDSAVSQPGETGGDQRLANGGIVEGRIDAEGSLMVYYCEGCISDKNVADRYSGKKVKTSSKFCPKHYDAKMASILAM